jgi:hypothetical protein
MRAVLFKDVSPGDIVSRKKGDLLEVSSVSIVVQSEPGLPYVVLETRQGVRLCSAPTSIIGLCHRPRPADMNPRVALRRVQELSYEVGNISVAHPTFGERLTALHALLEQYMLGERPKSLPERRTPPVTENGACSRLDDSK